MKFLLSLFLVALLGLCECARPQRGPAFCLEDGVVDQGLRNKKFTDNIVMCLMKEKPCEGKVETDIYRKNKSSFASENRMTSLTVP